MYNLFVLTLRQIYDENMTQFTIQPANFKPNNVLRHRQSSIHENAIKVQKYNTAETGVGLVRNKLGGSNLP